MRAEDNDDDGWHRYGDEEINDKQESVARRSRTIFIPPKLKATIQFGYEDGMKKALGTQDFDTWITATLAHAQAHFRHAKSLGTTIEFEVRSGIIHSYMMESRSVTNK